MKKKVFLMLLPALMALSACAGVETKEIIENNDLAVNAMAEDTEAHEELFGAAEYAGDLNIRAPRKLGEALTKPVVGVQYQTEGDGDYAIRYVAAINSLSVSATWTRDIGEPNGSRPRDGDPSIEIPVTKAYSALSEEGSAGDDAPVYPSSVGANFNYFVVYTLHNIPAAKLNSYLFAYLTIDDGVSTPVKSLARISRVSGGNSFKIDPDVTTGYFLQGDIAGDDDNIVPVTTMPSGSNYAQQEDLVFAANDTFGLFKWGGDHFQFFGYEALRRGAPFLPRIAGNDYIKATGAGTYKLYLTRSNEIHIVTPDSVKSSATYYLKPNANWASANARFAAYFCNGESAAQWVNMTPVGDGFYSVSKPAGDFANIIFCRMNPDIAENSFDKGDGKPLWNQTADLSLDDGGNTYFINDGQWNPDAYGGNWNLHIAA